MPSVTTRKRKAMALDTSEGCKKCGILHKSLKMMRDRGKQRELCQACVCAETMELSFQTPCGQHYCKGCGFLIESVGPNYCAPDRCSACLSKQSSYIQCEDFRKAAGTCECEFCSNHYSQTLGKILQTKTSMEENFHFVQKNQMPISESDSDLDPPRKENRVEEEIRKTWEREQLALKRQLLTQDCPSVKRLLRTLMNKDTGKTFYIGGVDISFIKGNSVDACAALMIVSFPELKVVYKRLEMIQLTAPYIPGFLAFREVDSIIQLYKAMLKNAPCYKPDVIFVDGNGQLHPRGFGLACHLGVLLDVPCVGVAKTLIHVDGIEESAAHKAKKQSLSVGGDTFPLTTDGGDTLGMALRSTDSAPNPIYVSVGHKISLQSAVRLVHHCCKYRIPEPTRFADMYSRQYLANEERSPEEFIA